MKTVFILACMYSLALANVEVEINSEQLKNILNTNFNYLEIDLPKEVVDALNPKGELIEGSAAGITAVINDYVDKIMINVQNQIVRQGLDPVALPNTTLDLIPTGTITLSSGWLQDTSNLIRNGDVTVTYSSSTKNMEFTLPIKFNSLLITYQYLTKVLLVSIQGDVNGKLDALTINVKLSFNYGTYKASLDNFDITDTGKFTLSFKGNPLVDWLTNTMTEVVTVFVEPIILRIIQSIVKGGLQEVVDIVNSFIDSILESP